MNYVDMLRQRAEEVGNIACVGLDPVLARIPIKDINIESRIFTFWTDLLFRMKAEGVMPAAVKPNEGWYEQYGTEGLHALKMVIEISQQNGIPVILDAKRGDIGKSSAAYAAAGFDVNRADAMTVHPYMGKDSIAPFLANGKGVYILTRTSNPGARDIQDLVVQGGKPVYWHVAKKICTDWYAPGIGSVIGATYPDELRELSTLFVESGKDIPILIPGVGDQGGSAKDVMRILRETGNDPRLHRINSSSGITYAYEKRKTDDYAGAAVQALKDLIKDCSI
jgi:orotidine-5'-phosphate decarboxylase